MNSNTSGMRSTRNDGLGNETDTSSPRASQSTSRVTKGQAEVKPAPHALEGVRLLDFSRIWAGPHATKLLADMGAEVIKVESTRAWDPHRMIAGSGNLPDGDPGPPEDLDTGGDLAWNARALLSEPRFWLLVVPVGIMMGISMG